MRSASGSGNDIRPNKTRRNPHNMTPPADDGTAKPQKKTGTGEEGVALEHLRPVSQTTLPGKVVWETGLRCSRATPSSPVPVFFWGLAVPSSAGGVMLLGFLLVLLGRISFPEPEADHIAVLYQVVFALQTQASGGLYLCLASQRIQVSEVGNFRLDEAFPKIRVDCSSGLGAVAPLRIVQALTSPDCVLKKVIKLSSL